MDNNPYVSPESPPPPGTPRGELHDPKKVSISDALSWINAGLYLFKQRPSDWITAILVYAAMTIGVAIGSMIFQIIPVLGFVAGQVISDVFWLLCMAGFMYGARQIHFQGKFEVNDLFMGFKFGAKPLAIVAAIFAITNLILMIGAIVGIAGPTLTGMLEQISQGVAPVMSEQASYQLLLAMLVYLALFMPLLMTVYFAPALAVFHELPPMQLIRMSFVGCMINMVPFLVFSIAYLLLLAVPIGVGVLLISLLQTLSPALAGTLAFLFTVAGLLCWGAITTGTIYAGYRDIYIK